MKTRVALSPSEVAQYRRDGFLAIRRPVLDADRLARLKQLFERLLAERGEDGLDVPHFTEPALLEFLMADEVLDLVEPLVGPDIGLWSSHFISKPPHVGPATPWHEDGAYWDGRISTMDNIVTLWLALDATDPENGSMGVVPGSHRQGGYVYESVPITGEVFDRRIRPDLIDERQAVFFTLAPGECSLHDARIVHGSHANTSPRRRAGYTMRYFPTTSRIFPEANGTHRVWLARGRDHAGNRYANIAGPDGTRTYSAWPPVK